MTDIVELYNVGTSAMTVEWRDARTGHPHKGIIRPGVLGTPADAHLVAEYNKAHPGSLQEALFLFEDPEKAVVYLWQLAKAERP